MSATKTQTIKLQTNIPLVGTLKYADHKPSTTEGWADQIRLKGQFDGKGEGYVYIGAWMADKLVKQGIIEVTSPGDEESGESPSYRVIYKDKVQILREEEGTKKITTILPLGAAPTAAGAESRPAASPSKGSAIPVSATAVPASVPPLQDGEPWKALARSYKKAVEVASWAWGGDEVTLNDEAIVAAAATVFIEANKRGLSVPAPVEKLSPEQKAERIRDAIDKYAEKPEALKDDADDDLPFSGER